MGKHHHKNSRRNFIKTASCAAVGCSTLFSTLINLKAANAAAMASSTIALDGDYKALVCINLGGGNDSYNMLVPTDNTEYNSYAATRSNLAINKFSLRSLNVLNSSRGFGVHPAMTDVQTLFNDQKLAFVANVGTLIEPVSSVSQVWNETIKLPIGLLSHLDQSMHWQTGFAHQRTAAGWGGRVADLIGDMNTNQNISMNISLSGSNTYQTGENTIEYVIDSVDGSTGIIGADNGNVFNSARIQAIDNMIDQSYADVFKQTYVNTIKNARSAHNQFSSALAGVTPFTTSFPSTELGDAMKMVANTIAARTALGMRRQTFFINFDGWDNHDELLNSQDANLGELSQALGAFQSAMEELNCDNDVTSFVISDFARTLTSNGNGTDHAWGGNVMAMGGAVNGGRIFGTYPDLALSSNLDIGNGILYPTTSADTYFAELALWFGVPASDLTTIFPNLGNFYDTGSGTNPLGFMNMV